MNIALLGMTLLGGVLLSAQSSINGAFGQKAGALESTFLTFFTGMLLLALAVLFFGQGDVLMLLDAPTLATQCRLVRRQLSVPHHSRRSQDWCHGSQHRNRHRTVVCRNGARSLRDIWWRRSGV